MRLTKTYEDGTYGVADDLPCGENSHAFKKLLIDKLGSLEECEAELTKEREANQMMRKCLEWYAHKPRYSSDSTDPDYPYQRTPEVYGDGGKYARTTLAVLEGNEPNEG